jgi:hypothetical protein
MGQNFSNYAVRELELKAEVELKKLETEQKKLETEQKKLETEQKKLEMETEQKRIEADKEIRLAESLPKKVQFPFKSEMLAKWGCGTLTEQYGIYGSTIAGLFPFGYYTRKYYIMEQYLKEPNVEMKKAWARKFPFDPAELDAGEVYLNRFGRSPRWWLIVAFIGPLYVLKKATESYRKHSNTPKAQ